MVKCPRCGNELGEITTDHYLYCVKFYNDGCDSLWATSKDCYFTQLYVIDELGVIAYKQAAHEGGKIIKTDKLLSKYPPRGLP